MPRGRSAQDLSTLQMALIGYQIEKQKIEERIQQIQAQLKGKHVPSSAPASKEAGAAPKRMLSPAARKRIAAAQRKRWAEHRKKLAAAKTE